jgi:hypothetical protein
MDLEGIENVLTEFREFLNTKSTHYELVPPNPEPIIAYGRALKAKIAARTGKTFDDLFPEFLIPGFDVIFKVDDMIDNGTTLEEQRIIVDKILASIESGNLDFPEEIARPVRDTILTSEIRKRALLSELAAEKALLNPDLDWVDAMIERVRVALYSALLVLDLPKLMAAYEYYKEDIASSPEQITNMAAMWAIAIATVDDYLDCEADLEHHKVTGMTRCDNPKALFTTVVAFFRTRVGHSIADLWPIEAFTSIYFDPLKCIRICYQETPTLAKYLFRTEKEKLVAQQERIQ